MGLGGGFRVFSMRLAELVERTRDARQRTSPQVSGFRG